LALFFDAANFVCVRPPIDFGATARRVAPTARRGAGRPGAWRLAFFETFFEAFFAFFDTRAEDFFTAFAALVTFRLDAAFGRAAFFGFLRPIVAGAAVLVRLRAPDVLRVAPALATRFAARSVARLPRLSIALVRAAALFAPVRAADPTRVAADVAVLAVDVSVPAARPSIVPTTSAPRSTTVIVVSAACENGSPGRVVLLSAIRRTSKQQKPSRHVPNPYGFGPPPRPAGTVGIA
jgi:hypothetical protein